MENSEKNENFVGEIFDNIKYSSKDDLDNLLDNLNKNQLEFFNVLALTKAYERGCFSLVEAEIVSKILRKI